MNEILTAGYQAIRNYVQANWKYIELRNASNAPILRISTSDPRVTWTNLANAQTLELTIVVKGSDAGLSGSLPLTFASSALFDVATGGSPYSVESFTPFAMEAPEDQLTIKHQVQIPQVV